MNEKWLHVFVVLARARSFSIAARELDISQSTVTKYLQHLERELEVLLIERKTVTLTAEGDALYAQAEQWLQDWYRLRSQFNKNNKPHAETLKLGASTTPGTYFLPGLCAKCHDQFPGTKFYLQVDDSSMITDLLLQREVDAVIIGQAFEHPGVQTTPLWKDHLTLIGPPGSSVEAAGSFSDISRYPFIKRKKGSGTYLAAEQSLQQWGGSLLDLETAAVVPNTESVLSLVQSGIGYGIISEYALASALSRGCVNKGRLPGFRHLHLSILSDRTEEPMIHAFSELARSFQAPVISST
ncbi:selenium metabolism-associated LysR family transcriptional regulator [Sinobaca sp. H24]|uniref:selenium metabolism-associated LysR family transcriptional regulator n=1 Tax=Sinobaca sp. H24 TaxID=2923376 RepID=UPI00207A0099|nr:selenium metabolism-associated LysR family transcriptional regulator [Sinobaca sp. H24]